VPSSTIIGYALSTPQPIYPRDQPRGVVGTVVLQVTISREGDVTDIRTLSGPVEMRPVTVQAVQAWRFRPYLVNGNPVEVTTTLGFLFRGQ
jgi:protein TonB